MTLLLDAPDLSLKQARLLCAIAYLTAERGRPPTCRELMAELHLGFPNTLRGFLVILRRQGYVTWEAFHARTLRLTKPLQWMEVPE